MKGENIIGVDVGGTKCAITYGKVSDAHIHILDKVSFQTTGCTETISEIKKTILEVLDRNNLRKSDIYSIGISCGGPLDSRKGVIMSPPNLTGWDNVPIVSILSDEFGIPCVIQNDANACALAEWLYGAGKGTKNMIFLTFGTGLGAGLILNGELYTGTTDNAGEVGHIRLSEFGPIGYGKSGSFEGFCSGGGIKQLAQASVRERMQMGDKVEWCPEGNLESITAKSVAEAMVHGNELAKSIYVTSAEYLGKGLSILIDILNPEVIVIGSIYARNESFMGPIVKKIVMKESLKMSAGVCKIFPAALGNDIGDYAAISVGASLLKK